MNNNIFSLFVTTPIFTNDFAEFITKLHKFHTPLVLITDHQCPICENYIYDLTNIEYLEKHNMCLGCDHLLSDSRRAFDNQLLGGQTLDEVFDALTPEVSNA